MFDPDICLCDGRNCSLKDTCLRFKYHLKSKKEDYNTYFETPPGTGSNCSFYIQS